MGAAGETRAQPALATTDVRTSVARGGAAGFGRCPVAAVAAAAVIVVVVVVVVVADDGNAPKTFRTVTRHSPPPPSARSYIIIMLLVVISYCVAHVDITIYLFTRYIP